MKSMHNVVILGAGHAGFQCAASLRQYGFAGKVTLVGNEGGLPYWRPPLSKGYLLGTTPAADLAFRSERFFAEQSIGFITAEAEAIERAVQHVVLRSGERLAYDHLVIACGSRPRPLRVPGTDLHGVLELRTRADADRLRAALADCSRVVVVGAGFIGLEFAATARALGRSVTVLDVADRPMVRVLSPDCAQAFARYHRDQGTALLLRTSLRALAGTAGRVSGVVTHDDKVLPADVVLACIGATPCTELAEQAGLPVDDGIVVDAVLLTADPQVSAIGDVAAFPHPCSARRIRLESVQNATDQARSVAARLAGRGASPYEAVPWFWSDQGDLKLQIAGLRMGDEEHVVFGDALANSFSVLCIADGLLRAVESVNRPADHMLARRLLAKRAAVEPAVARQPEFSLKALL